MAIHCPSIVISRVGRAHAIGVLALALLVGACASSHREPACPQDGRMALMVVDTLYFGTDRAKDGSARPVTQEEWRTFIDRTVTPLFPAGFTSWNASGQWREPNGTVTREASYVLQIAHASIPADETSVQEIIETYKHDFGQKSVMRVRALDCVSFNTEKS